MYFENWKQNQVYAACTKLIFLSRTSSLNVTQIVGLRRSILRIHHFTPNGTNKLTQNYQGTILKPQVWNRHRRHLVSSEREDTTFTWFQQESDFKSASSEIQLTGIIFWFWDLFWSEKNYQEVNKLTSSHLIHVLPPPPSSPSPALAALEATSLTGDGKTCVCVCVSWVDISWKTNRKPL